MIAQVEPALSHRAGLPAQFPAQHSSLVAQVAPVARHAEVHTGTPASSAVHEPSQHVSSLAHGAPRGRHGPGPNSQREVAGSQPPQQGGMLIPVHASPSARQSAAASVQTPSAIGHSPEQQSPSAVHGVPSTAHSVAPQVPALHPSEQQSDARLQDAPSTRQ